MKMMPPRIQVDLR